TFAQLVAQRYSVRSYKPDEVEQEKLDAVLEAARLAPTAASRQPFALVVVHTRDRGSELSEVCKKDWMLQAPLIICACSMPAQAWVRRDGKNYSDVDIAIVMDHLVLAATEQGLGTCWIAAFDAAAAKRVLRLPDGVEPVVLTPLGYANDTAKPKNRKPLDQLVHYEYFQGKK
ncbi:MAG: nitroreductase family protein, partial [Chloroflexi bacterium]|nr:nitroreductase family protein [Chloroflexota bacterium]